MKSAASLEIKRHSLEHVMSAAMIRLFGKKVKMGIGPIIESGFYQDLDYKVTETDFAKIENEMHKIISENQNVVHELMEIDQAIAMYKKANQPFKVELLENIKSKGTTKMNSEEEAEAISKLTEAGKVSFFTIDVYKDLCRGPHVENTSELKDMVFKLDRVAGAYWRGDEKNQMLTRVYAVAFESQAELDEYYSRQEQAKLRDHRTLGKKYDLFTFSDLVGKGLPLWTEHGAAIRRELEKFIVEEELKRGYKHVVTPELANVALYEKSGHYPYYKESMYPPMQVDEERLMLRPMTCPHHFSLYLDKPRSYKELPMRIAELSRLYRYEKSGELTGLIRVRSFCLADSHIIARESQSEQEVNNALDLIEYLAQVFGLKAGENFRYRLSLGDRSDDKKYFKNDAGWDHAEGVLRKVLTDRKAVFFEAPGEAAFYGPKIDIQMKNVNGKEDTAFTVQYDFVMPGRFELDFTNENGEKERAIVIHRSSIGAIERVVAFLLEHYAGAFPTWMAPVQVKIIPIGEKQQVYAEKVKAEILAAGLEYGLSLRIEVDNRDETLQARIKDAAELKLPYILIVGGREEEANKVAVRVRGKGDTGAIDLAEFSKKLVSEVKSRQLESN